MNIVCKIFPGGGRSLSGHVIACYGVIGRVQLNDFRTLNLEIGLRLLFMNLIIVIIESALVRFL